LSRRDFEELVKDLSKQIRDFVKLIFNEASKRLSNGESLNKVVEETLKEFDFENKIKSIYKTAIPQVAESLGATFKNQSLVGSYFERSWLDDKLNLTDRISNATKETKVAIKKVIRDGVKKRKSTRTLTNELLDIVEKKDNIRINKKLSEISKLTRDDKNTQRKIKAFRREISKFGEKGDLTTSRTKRAYERVLKAVESGNQERIATAIDNAYNTKLKYRAEMIVRTEMNHAYTQMFNEKQLRDDDVVGYKWNTTSNHHVDQCDFFEFQNVGLGSGIYKKGQAPNGGPPVHPNCMCYLTPVYVGEVSDKALKKDYDIESGEKWLKRQSKEDQEAMMGVGNRERWRKGQLDFKEAIKDYSEPGNIKKIGSETKKKIIFK